ncbi:MAG: c-type cytochrome [Planctomycetaceae bacterium]|nr:c-type cytochrome [Planctomycetaceae bacterium]MBT4846696.1 c-type cytochrome [Planctomycetaceae bacterium]MBT5125067.1 c-type cytochrome [Planctomycetaceae bacterium]MBT5598500.1 c-type cytochrome [Planctomycetaceae bacterium]MBT5885484.1 c-type cytochrome [Planctomycetaceae bacterium]
MFIIVICGTVAGQVQTQQPTVAPSVIRVDLAANFKPEEPTDAPAGEILDVKLGPVASWLWRKKQAGDGERVTFVKTIELEKVTNSTLVATCDNHFVFYVNGQRVASGDEWASSSSVSVAKHLKVGKNELRAVCVNDGVGLGGFVCKLVLQLASGKLQYVVSDEHWTCTVSDGSPEMQAVFVHGKHGMRPWGTPLHGSSSGALVGDVPPQTFQLLPGFQVELLYSVPRDTQGSWVCIAFDKKGRLIASDQGGKGLYRITPAALAGEIGPPETTVEKLDVPMTSAHGMLFAFDSLYVSANGGPGSGLYRLRDTNGDDQFDEVKKLKVFRGGGEHGPHSLRLSPDGKSIVVIAGNHTDIPADLDASRIPTNWSEDFLLPRQWDARGHAAGKLAPGGWIAQTDPDGKHWELLSMGYRNPFDFAFNTEGDIFAYDADMEWDYGTPWYRPTRVVHATSGSEFGWRSGTGKWPTYYADSLPPAVDIGPGSPVGVAFGYGTKFPAKYRHALYCLDWTFGTMYAVHFTPAGSSYTAVKEEFLSRTPLPLTDAAIGPDGAMYFTIGGRGAQSELYRVTYRGDKLTGDGNPTGDSATAQQMRKLRRSLEQLHHHANEDSVAETVTFALKHIGHSDRHIRYAARIALENQPVSLWRKQVIPAKSDNNPLAVINGTIALARQGESTDAARALTLLQSLSFQRLERTQQLDLLRAYSLVFIRLGNGSPEQQAAVLGELDPLFPAKDNALNRELCNVLVYLNSATIAGKCLKLMGLEDTTKSDRVEDFLTRNRGYGQTIANSINNRPEIQKMHYAYALRNLRYGWTLEQRREYLEWFVVARKKSGGASYVGFLDNIQKEAVANMSQAERDALADSTLRPPPSEAELPKAVGPGSEWTVEQLLVLAKSGLSERNFDRGKTMFAAAKCGSCHRFDGAGGATGPDLSNVAGRYSHRDLIEAIVLPSKVISDQYRAMVITTNDGKVYSGRVTNDTDGVLTVSVDAVDPTKTVVVKKSNIDEMAPAKVSLMPAKLLNELNQGEVLDLLAYMLSRGNPQSNMFGSINSK